MEPSLRKRQSGFTMVELLISVILLSGIVFIASLSFSVFSRYWQQQTGHFDSRTHELRNQLAMKNSLSSTANYIVDDANGQPIYYFQGNRNEIRYVTNSPIFSHSDQALVHIFIERDEFHEDRLIYREAPMHRKPFLRVSEPPGFEYEQVFMQAENIRFNFYGWEHTDVFNQFFDQGNTTPVWSDNYNAAISGIMPLALNLSWADDEPVIFPLPSDRGILMDATRARRDDSA